MGTFDCTDLDTFDCGIVQGLCATSFVKVVCPDKCTKCQATTTQGPTTPAPTTPAVQVKTSVIPNTANQCSDHLDGMACNQLADVCSSVLALSVCPKYCGLC